MNIRTELIKNKTFPTQINSRLLKHSHEYRVLATLRYLFPSVYSTMTHSDSPDLQDPIRNIGIEVTDAISENDAKVSASFAKLRQSKESKKQIRKIESCGYSFTKMNNDINKITATGTADKEKVIFQQTIRKKAEKINHYKIHFKTIGLAILLPEIPSYFAENHFHEWIFDVFKEYDNFFSFVYVISERFCIYNNILENKFEKYLLNEKETIYLRTIGRMTAEGDLSLSDIEWQIP